MKIALGQINPTIADFKGNLNLICDAHAEATRRDADLIVFPELSVCGYPARDLLQSPSFVSDAQKAFRTLVEQVRGGTAVLVGYPEAIKADVTAQGSGPQVANAAALIEDGKIIFQQYKNLLPTYDVFDEKRYFVPGESPEVFCFRGTKLGVSICEDIWNDADFWPKRLYPEDPIEQLVKGGADIIINMAASPFAVKKRSLRPQMLAATAKKWCKPLVFVNQVGGQDDLIFDGSSLFIDADGVIKNQAQENESDLLVVDTKKSTNIAGKKNAYNACAQSDIAAMTSALVLGIRDYARRCNFSSAIIGLSGGIDSAVVAALATRALGPDKVTGVAMPSRYSSPSSLEDARALADNAGIKLSEISIEPMFASYLSSLQPLFGNREADVTEENLQARIRGALLMALSNKFSSLLLTTGNKSEVAMGYCTLYGDMAGGLAVIADVLKTEVYEMAEFLNLDGEIIPVNTIAKPPSAELRPGQLDQDSLPPYEILDSILRQSLEQDMDADELVAAGHDEMVVKNVLGLLERSEYKRLQMPPGLKVSPKAFGPGRRVPIAKKYTRV